MLTLIALISFKMDAYFVLLQSLVQETYNVTHEEMWRLETVT